MCLMIEKDIRPSVAERDITVFKTVRVVSGKIQSIIFSYTWTLGLLRVTKMEESRDLMFFDTVDSECHERFDKHNDLKAIGRGLHSFGRLSRALHVLSQGGRIMMCRIPKGALYYHNLSDLYVSNKLIPLKLIQ